MEIVFESVSVSLRILGPRLLGLVTLATGLGDQDFRDLRLWDVDLGEKGDRGHYNMETLGQGFWVSGLGYWDFGFRLF